MEALVARRTLFDEVGLFDPHSTTGGDVDWFARVKDLHIPMAILPKILVHKRVHDQNVSLDVEESHRSVLRALRASIQRKHHA